MVDVPLIKSLPVNQVDVWLFAPQPFRSRSRDQLRNLLSADEIERADRFVRPTDSEKFVIARVALRMIVGRYAGLDAKHVEFDYGELGKPFLRAGKHVPRVFFNSSHSQGRVAIAVSHLEQIGVDIEFETRVSKPALLARAVLSPTEQVEFDAIERSDSRQRIRYMLQRWTMKEAIVKATGLGLTQPLRELNLSEVGVAAADAAGASDEQFGNGLSIGQPTRYAVSIAGDPQSGWTIDRRDLFVNGSLAVAVSQPSAETEKSSLPKIADFEPLSISIRRWLTICNDPNG